MSGRRRSAAVLYSGGVDSLYAAERLTETFEHVHLLTFRVPGLVFLSWIDENLATMRRRHGRRVTHRLIDARPTFARVRGPLRRECRDIVEHGSHETLCLACKTILFTEAVRYCKRHGVSAVSDGSSRLQNGLWESDLFWEIFQRYLARHGIERVCPTRDLSSRPPEPKMTGFVGRWLRKARLDIDRAHQKSYLLERGYRLGLAIGDQHRFIQPWCSCVFTINVIGDSLSAFFPDLLRGRGLEAYVLGLIEECERSVLPRDR